MSNFRIAYLRGTQSQSGSPAKKSHRGSGQGQSQMDSMDVVYN